MGKSGGGRGRRGVSFSLSPRLPIPLVRQLQLAPHPSPSLVTPSVPPWRHNWTWAQDERWDMIKLPNLTSWAHEQKFLLNAVAAAVERSPGGQHCSEESQSSEGQQKAPPLISVYGLRFLWGHHRGLSGQQQIPPLPSSSPGGRASGRRTRHRRAARLNLSQGERKKKGSDGQQTEGTGTSLKAKRQVA